METYCAITTDSEVFGPYCLEHAREALELMSEDTTAELGEYAGGYKLDMPETDSPEHCIDCGELLETRLTDRGLDYVRDEIVKSLSEGNALGLDEDSAVYAWHVAYGDYVKERITRELDGPDVSEILDNADVLRSYLETQVWTGSISWMTNTAEFGGEEYTSDGLLDRYISADDLAADIVTECTKDVDAFIDMIEPYLAYWELPAELGAEQIGHDFSLTRNHHGTGFWDRGYGALGDWLTRCAQSFGSSSLYGYIVLDSEYATRADNGSLEFDLEHVLADTLTVYLEG